MQEQSHLTPGFTVRRDKPLVGIITRENNEEVVHYFTDEQDVDAATTQDRVQRALNLAGAWQDLGDWDEAQKELDRIRHESRPSPPVEL